MNIPVLVGERILLRPVSRQDATLEYVSWLNDPETTRYMESGRRQESIESITEYIARYENREDVRFMAIVLKDRSRHVGNLKLEPINWTHRNAVLGIMIGDPRVRGKGIGTEAILLMLRYAFDDLKLHRISLGVTADNRPAIKCYQEVGFKEEGRCREAILRETGYIDSLCMAILADEFHARYC